MLNTVQQKFSLLQSEFAYRAALRKYNKNLSLLEPQDQTVVDALKREGVCVTCLESLGLTSTPQLLNAARKYLSIMEDNLVKRCGDSNQVNQAVRSVPQIFTVTDLPDFFLWGMEKKLLKIIENYIGLPVAFQGVHLRRDFPNEKQIGTLLWHKDGEDRRIVKIFIYLDDVTEDQGPFEYIPRYLTSSKLIDWRISYKISKTNFLGIGNEEIEKIIPKSAWKSCPGSAGKVIFVDTQSVYHHGALRKFERPTLFFVYTAKNPKRPDLCTQYNDDTFARPEIFTQPAAVKN
jgi:hypothetical protein